MTERLPNSDEEPWDALMGANDNTGGWLRVAHNDDGTQIYPGASLLWVGAELTDQASGTYPQSPGGGFQWVEGFMGPTALPASAGSDVSINGGDPSVIDINTTGWYQGLFQCTFLPKTGGDVLTFFECGFGPSSQHAQIWSTNFGMGTTETVDPGATGCQAMPLQYLTAGDQIYHFIGSYVSNAAHLWNANAFMQIIRMA